jgi:hypothetical protein
MDYFETDIAQLSALFTKRVDPHKISRADEQELKRLQNLIAHHQYAVMLHTQQCDTPFFICKRFFSWIDAGFHYEYTTGDYLPLLRNSNNVAMATIFFSHFGNNAHEPLLCWWKFKNMNKVALNIFSISCLIIPGGKSAPFILTLLYSPGSSLSTSDMLLHDLCCDIDMEDLNKKAELLKPKLWEVFEKMAYGIPMDKAFTEVDLAYTTYEAYCKLIRKHFGHPPESLLSRYYFALKYQSRAA